MYGGFNEKNGSAEDGMAHPAAKHTFSGSYLGFVVLAVLLILTLAWCSLSPVFFNINNILNMIKQLVPYGLIAIAVVLTTRAKGPNLSLGAVMTLSGMVAATAFASGSSVAASIAVALLSAALAGAVNGALTVYLRLPSILSSAVILVVLSFTNWVISQGRPVIVKEFNERTQAALLPGAAIILPLVIIAAFLFVYFTRLGKPMNTRRNGENRNPVSFVAYIAGALLAGIAGIYALSRIGAAVPRSSNDYLVYILFIFGILLSSRLLDNRSAPVFFAFGAAFLYGIMNNAMNLLGVASFWQVVFTGLFTIIFIVVGVFANRGAVRNMLTFK